MIKIRVNQSELHFIRREVIASGAVKAYKVHFTFDESWNGLKKIALFKAGDVGREVPLDENNLCEIPWEVLKEAGIDLEIGIVGLDHNALVLPTIWVNAGMIQVGIGTGNLAPPSPSLYQQLLNMIGDLQSLKTVNKANLVSAINEVFAGKDHDIAVDKEVSDMLENIFGKFTGVPVPDDQIAADKEVDNMLDTIFGEESIVVPNDSIADDAEINSMLGIQCLENKINIRKEK